MDDLYLVTKGLKLNRQYSGAEKEMRTRLQTSSLDNFRF